MCDSLIDEDEGFLFEEDKMWEHLLLHERNNTSFQFYFHLHLFIRCTFLLHSSYVKFPFMSRRRQRYFDYISYEPLSLYDPDSDHDSMNCDYWLDNMIEDRMYGLSVTIWYLKQD